MDLNFLFIYVLITGFAVIDRGKEITERIQSGFFWFIPDLEQRGGYVV
jgi:hypothetical protein